MTQSNLLTQMKEIKAKEAEVNLFKKDLSTKLCSFLSNFEKDLEKISKEHDLGYVFKNYNFGTEYKYFFNKKEDYFENQYEVTVQEVFGSDYNFYSFSKITSFNEDFISFITVENCGDYSQSYEHMIPTEWLDNSDLSQDFIKDIILFIKEKEYKEEEKARQEKEAKDKELYEELKNKFEKK